MTEKVIRMLGRTGPEGTLTAFSHLLPARASILMAGGKIA